MSLLDALLQDPHKHPKDVWIALRADGNMGSGTAEDPYNGGLLFEEEKEVYSLSHEVSSYNGTEIVTGEVTFSSAHGYSVGDLLTVSRAKVGGHLSNIYNKTFVVIEIVDSTKLLINLG